MKKHPKTFRHYKKDEAVNCYWCYSWINKAVYGIKSKCPKGQGQYGMYCPCCGLPVFFDVDKGD